MQTEVWRSVFQDWLLQVFHGEFDSTYCCLDHVFTQSRGVDRGASRICRCDHVTSILAHFDGMESGRQSCRYLFMQKADACWHPWVSDTTAVGISTAVTSLRNLLDGRRFFAMEVTVTLMWWVMVEQCVMCGLCRQDRILMIFLQTFVSHPVTAGTYFGTAGGLRQKADSWRKARLLYAMLSLCRWYFIEPLKKVII